MWKMNQLKDGRLGIGCLEIEVGRWKIGSTKRREEGRKDLRHLRFPVFGHRGVELGQPLQAGELVEDEPHRSMTGPAAVHQPQHKHVEPEAREWNETGTCFRRTG